jgi:GTPase Era involved in 16S rRNA processing
MPYEDMNIIFEKMFKNEKICCISIFGMQSTGKSTTLNHLLRTRFLTSNGRCTQGCFASILKIDNELHKTLIEALPKHQT